MNGVVRAGVGAGMVVE